MIDSASAFDVDDLARVHAACFDRPWRPPEIAHMLSNPAVFAFAAREPGVTAFAMGWVAAGEAEVLTVAVAPSSRRTGKAQALLNTLAVAAKARGAGAVHLDVAETNVPARALYAKLGYREVGRRKDYYETATGRVDAIVLRLDLEQASV